MHKKMGYFNGWKFGVPISLIYRGARISHNTEARLIRETDNAFWAIVGIGARSIMYYEKCDFSYIPIPHRVDIMQPRFPVCSNRHSTVYCNKGGKTTRFAVADNRVQITEIKELEGAKCSART